MGKPALNDDKLLKIKDLRSSGYSLPEISREVGVPRSTVFRYVKDVEILPEFIELWKRKRSGSRHVRLLKEEKALKEAKELLGELSNKEKILFISALYWGEGSKRDFGLSNTDPKLIKVFIEGLRDVFKIDEDRFRISIRIFEDMDRDKCLDFWSNITGIAKDRFINVDVLKGKKNGKLEFGMCRIRVTKGADLLKQIKGINEALFQAIASMS
jgi:hypothetical protein